MDCFLSIDKKSYVLQLSLKATTNLKHNFAWKTETESVPINKISSLSVDIHDREWKVSQNNSVVMREYLRIDKSCQTIERKIPQS